MPARVSHALLRWLLWSAGVVASDVVLAWATSCVHPAEVVLWPSAAVAAFALLARGPSMLPAVVLASWVNARVLLGWGMQASGLVALGDALGPLVGLWMLRRRPGGWQGFSTTADAGWFIVAMGAASAAVSAAIAAVAASVFGPGEGAVGVRWWVTVTTSVVVFTPFAELARRLGWAKLRASLSDEVVALSAFALGSAAVVYLLPARGSALLLGLASLSMLPLLWAALRLPPVWTTALSAAVSVLAVCTMLLGRGPMASLVGTERFLAVQLILLSMAGALLLAALMASERALALAQVRDINATLEKKISRRTAALQIAQATAQAQLRFQESLLNALPNPVAFSDAHGRFTRVNTAFNLLVSLGNSEIFGRTATQILGPSLGRIWEEMDDELRAGEVQVSGEATYQHPDHEPTVWILNKALVRDAVSRQIVGVVTSMQDITALKLLQQQLSEDEQRFRFLAEESPVPLVITRLSDAALLFSNKASDDLFRATFAQHAGNSMHKLWTNPADRDHLIARLQREGGVVRGMEAKFRRFDGSEVWLLLSATRGRYRDEDALILAFKDITEVKEREAELRSLAYTDVLTGVPNRRYFLARAAIELRKAQRDGSPLAVLALDIDRFKQINDTFGHQSGDAVIRCFAQTCMQQLRSQDICGRLGGDEFAILLPQTTRQVAFDVAQRLRLSLLQADCIPAAQQPTTPLRLTTSIGIAEYLPTSTRIDIDELLDRADQALYRAKQAGRNRIELWTGEPPRPV